MTRRSRFQVHYLTIIMATLAAAFVVRQLGSAATPTRRQLAVIAEQDTSFLPSSLSERTSASNTVIIRSFAKLFAAVGNPTVWRIQHQEENENVDTPDPDDDGSTRNNQLYEKQRQTRFEKYNNTYQYTPPAAARPSQPAPECGNGTSFRQFFKQSSAVRSRYGEDRQIYQHFFRDKLVKMNGTGTYVELGAFDGQTESNSRFFDVCLNWKGLLIEGNPTTFPKTQQARPNTHRMSFAPSCSAEYETVNKTVQFARYPMTNAGIRGKALNYDEKPQVDVPCGPLGPVLEDIFQGEPINFFSLDVEGSEVMVLRTIDFSRVQIQNSFCDENCASRDEIRDIMKNAGYKRYERLVVASDVYVRPDSGYVLEGYRLLG